MSKIRMSNPDSINPKYCRICQYSFDRNICLLYLYLYSHLLTLCQTYSHKSFQLCNDIWEPWLLCLKDHLTTNNFVITTPITSKAYIAIYSLFPSVYWFVVSNKSNGTCSYTFIQRISHVKEIMVHTHLPEDILDYKKCFNYHLYKFFAYVNYLIIILN